MNKKSSIFGLIGLLIAYNWLFNDGDDFSFTTIFAIIAGISIVYNVFESWQKKSKANNQNQASEHRDVFIETNSETKECEYCGHINDIKREYCENCGAKQL